MRTWKKLGIAALVVASVAAPTALMASDRFGDVPDTNLFHGDINTLADNKITLGCNVEGTLYCPTDNVTRQQMASFMVRLMGKAEGIAPSVHAATADSLSNQTTTVLTLAHGENADLLTEGPLRLSATCTDNAGTTEVRVLAHTTVDNAVLASNDVDDADFDIADSGAEVAALNSPAATPAIDNQGYPLVLNAPDGSSILGDDVVLGANVHDGATDCLVTFNALAVAAAA